MVAPGASLGKLFLVYLYSDKLASPFFKFSSFLGRVVFFFVNFVCSDRRSYF